MVNTPKRLPRLLEAAIVSLALHSLCALVPLVHYGPRLLHITTLIKAKIFFFKFPNTYMWIG